MSPTLAAGEAPALMALASLVNDPHAYDCSHCDRVPDELALGGLDGRAADAFRACTARTLRVRVQNDAVCGLFWDLPHIVFDCNLQGAAYALDDEFFRAQYSYFSDGGLVGVRTDDR